MTSFEFRSSGKSQGKTGFFKVVREKKEFCIISKENSTQAKSPLVKIPGKIRNRKEESVCQFFWEDEKRFCS